MKYLGDDRKMFVCVNFGKPGEFSQVSGNKLRKIDSLFNIQDSKDVDFEMQHLY